MSKGIKISALFTLALYVLPLVQSIGTIGVYLQNLDYISNELCVNRYKAEIHCEGTCVLAQMMNNQNEVPQSPFNNSENSIAPTEILAFIFKENLKTGILSTATIKPYSPYLIYYSYVPQCSLDQPPESLV